MIPSIYGADMAVSLILDKIVFKEVKVQGVNSQNIRPVIPAIGLAESRKYPIERMVTDGFPREEAEKTVRLVGGKIENEGAIKVVIVP